MRNIFFVLKTRTIAILFAILWIGIAGAQAASAKVNVVTTLPDFADITKQIGGDRVAVSSIGKGNQDPHFLDAKPSVMKTLSKADMLVAIGMEMEIGYIGPLLEGSRNSKIQKGMPGYIDASKGIPVREKPTGVVDRSQGDVHMMGNPHYWLDPMNGIIIATNIANGLMRIDPGGAPMYKSNLASFSEKIKTSLKKWRKSLAPFKGRKIVAYHNSWPYFTNRFDLDVIDYIEPRPGIPPTASHLVQLIQDMKDNNVGLILMEPYHDTKAARTLAEKTGARLLVVSPSVGGDPRVNDYFGLFDHLTAEIARNLSGK